MCAQTGYGEAFFGMSCAKEAQNPFDHPYHSPWWISRIKGSPYNLSFYNKWILGFYGPSEVEDFFRIYYPMVEHWYYVSVYEPAGPFIGSASPGVDAD